MNINLKKNKIILIMLFLVFILPMLFASYYYNNHKDLELGFNAKGDFVSDSSAYKYEFSDIKPSSKWSLVYVSALYCDNLCSKQINSLERVVAALGKYKSRVNFYSEKSSVLKKDEVVILDGKLTPVLRYKSPLSPRDILKDLRRLVRI